MRKRLLWGTLVKIVLLLILAFGHIDSIALNCGNRPNNNFHPMICSISPSLPLLAEKPFRSNQGSSDD